MFIFFTVVLVAIGLSMDTFSLSLGYGLFDLDKKKIYFISFFVGLFHFFMPLFGNIFGFFLFQIIPISENRIIGVVFLLISIELILSFFKNEDIKPINNFADVLLFSFAVSIDSFTTGIALDVFELPNLIVVTIFMVISFVFTYFGLSTGKKLHNIIGKKADYIGVGLLLSLSLFYLIC